MTVPGPEPDPETVAVIDIGSGSIKLLVTDAAGAVRSGHHNTELAIKTRLYAGAGDRLTDDALAATAAGFERFAAVVAEAEPSRTVAVATAAARAVADLGPLERLVEEAFGVGLEVISGEREAALSFEGAMSGRSLAGPVAMMDIGSASTEFAIDTGDGGRQVLSLPIGAGTVTDLYLKADPPAAEELSSALSVVELHLDDLRRELPDFGDVVESGTVLGVGAITEIAAVEIGLADPEEGADGYVLDKPSAEEVFRALATESAADRAHNPGLRPEHVGDIVGAMCVLVEFMRRFAVEEIVVSERSLLHGLAAEVLAGQERR